MYYNGKKEIDFHSFTSSCREEFNSFSCLFSLSSSATDWTCLSNTWNIFIFEFRARPFRPLICLYWDFTEVAYFHRDSFNSFLTSLDFLIENKLPQIISSNKSVQVLHFFLLHFWNASNMTGPCVSSSSTCILLLYPFIFWFIKEVIQNFKHRVR